MEQLLPGKLITFKYKLLSKIGEGSFGEVYEAVNIFSRAHVAIKFEHKLAKYPQLYYEYKVYHHIKSSCFPAIECYEQEGDFYYMVMELLNPSLEHEYTINEKCRKKEFIYTLSLQMVYILTSYHS